MPEVKITICEAVQFNRNFLTNNHVDLKISKAFAWRTKLLYGNDCWTMGKREKACVAAEEIWIWQRMINTN